MGKKVLIALLVFAMSFGGVCVTSDAQIHLLKKGRANQNLYEMLSDAKEVKVYLAPVTDSSGGQAGGMGEALHEALRQESDIRLSINFVEVTDPKDADLVVTCDIQERIWMEVDPVDQVHGIGAAVMDAALKENYGRMEAYFTISRGPNKQLFKRVKGLKKFRRMWSDEVKSTITQGDMPEEASKPLLVGELAHNFIMKAFGKRSKMERKKQNRKFTQ